MPKVNVEYKSTLKPQDAYTKIKGFFDQSDAIRRFDPKVKCEFPDGKSVGKVHGSQFKADITVHSEGPGSKILVVVDLPLILSPFKGKVEELIRRKLGKYLA